MEDIELEEELDSSSKKANPKINPIGKTFYGERFVKFDQLNDIRDLIPAYKSHYYVEKSKNFKKTSGDIIREFNEIVCYPEGRTFFPYTRNVKLWREKWDRDIIEQQKVGGITDVEQRQIRQIITTRDKEDNQILGIPQDDELEAGVRTLGGELLNDAMQMLRDDQQLEEIYDDETLMKRRSYIVNVFAHTTRMVQGKAALLLKASAEKRENASFLMTLLAKASSGKLSDEEMGSLKTTYSTVPVSNDQHS